MADVTSAGADHPIRILVVDDDEDDFQMLRDLLSEVHGPKFSLTWASNFDAGKVALTVPAQANTFDVCILDYRLGIRTGLDLLKEAQQSGCKTPIILLTGYGEHEVDLEAMRVGAADYLVKDQITPFLIERSIRYSIHRAQALQAILDRETQILVQDRLAAVGLLASSLAHEIGTPLGVIRGRAEYLGLQLRSNPEVAKNVDVIVTQIDRVSKLIRSLLNLARGDQTHQAAEIHLNEVLQEVLDLMAPELRKHSIELRNEVTSDVPIKARAESSPLHQVLLNLLINAVHAIDTAVERGRKTGHFIRIAAQASGSSWILSIQDSGCGISRENMRNLFKPFFTTKDIGKGTGLGLVTSYRIVESWGGSIQVDSTEGVGSEFRVLLPRQTGAGS